MAIKYVGVARPNLPIAHVSSVHHDVADLLIPQYLEARASPVSKRSVISYRRCLYIIYTRIKDLSFSRERETAGWISEFGALFETTTSNSFVYHGLFLLDCRLYSTYFHCKTLGASSVGIYSLGICNIISSLGSSVTAYGLTPRTNDPKKLVLLMGYT